MENMSIAKPEEVLSSLKRCWGIEILYYKVQEGSKEYHLSLFVGKIGNHEEDAFLFPHKPGQILDGLGYERRREIKISQLVIFKSKKDFEKFVLTHPVMSKYKIDWDNI